MQPALNAATRPRHRRGSSLVEFAFIALALYLLLALTIEMGRAVFGAETLQPAADLAAREIARTPLSVTYTSLYGSGGGDTTAALNDPAVRTNIYDERLLVIDLGLNPADPIATIQSFPVVNQQLFPLMIFDNLSIPGRNLLRYPGALVTPGDESAVSAVPLPTGFTDAGLRVAVPLVTYSGGGGSSVSESITWVSVLEEVNPGAFGLTPPATGPAALGPPGVVGVRVNYPFQAATLSGGYNATTPFEPGTPIKASDAGVSQTNKPVGGGTLAVGGDPTPASNAGLQPYGGEFGLGFQLAMGQKLRPFRSLLSAQAVYRREVFNP